MKRFLGISLFLAVFLIPLSGLKAQAPSGLRGTITDRNGVVLARTSADGNRIYPGGAAFTSLIGIPDQYGVEVGLDRYLAGGQNMQLTIDLQLQQVAFDALVAQIEALNSQRPDSPVRGGTVIALDPRNGQILALVSYP